MTTQVTIKKTDTGNHHDVMVTVVGPEGPDTAGHRLTESSPEVSLYVYDTQQLKIEEVEKENPETEVAADTQETAGLES